LRETWVSLEPAILEHKSKPAKPEQQSHPEPTMPELKLDLGPDLESDTESRLEVHLEEE